MSDTIDRETGVTIAGSPTATTTMDSANKSEPPAREEKQGQ